MLCECDLNEHDLIKKIQDEERTEIFRALNVLIRASLVSRSLQHEKVTYGIKEDHIRTVLRLLRKSFEDNLTDALALICDISYSRIHNEMTRLRSRFHVDPGLTPQCYDKSQRHV